MHHECSPLTVWSGCCTDDSVPITGENFILWQVSAHVESHAVPWQSCSCTEEMIRQVDAATAFRGGWCGPSHTCAHCCTESRRTMAFQQPAGASPVPSVVHLNSQHACIQDSTRSSVYSVSSTVYCLRSIWMPVLLCIDLGPHNQATDVHTLPTTHTVQGKIISCNKRSMLSTSRARMGRVGVFLGRHGSHGVQLMYQGS